MFIMQWIFSNFWTEFRPAISCLLQKDLAGFSNFSARLFPHQAKWWEKLEKIEKLLKFIYSQLLANLRTKRRTSIPRRTLLSSSKQHQWENLRLFVLLAYHCRSFSCHQPVRSVSDARFQVHSHSRRPSNVKLRQNTSIWRFLLPVQRYWNLVHVAHYSPQS